MEGFEFIIIIGVLATVIYFAYFFTACNNLQALRDKYTPSPKQMLKNAEIEYKLGNTAEADAMIKRVIVTVGEKNSLAKQAQKLQDAFKA